MIYSILLGRICCPEGKGTTGLQGPLQGAPPHPPPFTHKRQPQHRDHPTLIRIVRGFFNVPQNYQHSRSCETGPPVYRPYPRRLESLTICRWNYKGSTFLLSYFKTLSVGPVGVSESRSLGVSNSRPPASPPSFIYTSCVRVRTYF